VTLHIGSTTTHCSKSFIHPGAPGGNNRPSVGTPNPVQRIHLEVPSFLPRNAIERNLQTKDRLARTKRNSNAYITDWAIFAPQTNAIRKSRSSPVALSVQPVSGLKASVSDSVPRLGPKLSTSRPPLSAVTRASSARLPPYARTSLRTYFTLPDSHLQPKASPNNCHPATYNSPPSSPSLSTPPTSPEQRYPFSVPAIRTFSPPINKDYSLGDKFSSVFEHQDGLDFDIEAKLSSPMGPKVKQPVCQYEQAWTIPPSPPLLYPPPCYIPARVATEPVFLWDPPSPTLNKMPKHALLPPLVEDTILEENCPDMASYAEVFDFAIYLKRISEQCKSVRLSRSLAFTDGEPPCDAPIIDSGSVASSVTSSLAMDDIVVRLDAIKDEEFGGRMSTDSVPFGWTEKELMTVFA
jgi:hypothetical protein